MIYLLYSVVLALYQQLTHYLHCWYWLELVLWVDDPLCRAGPSACWDYQHTSQSRVFQPSTDQEHLTTKREREYSAISQCQLGNCSPIKSFAFFLCKCPMKCHFISEQPPRLYNKNTIVILYLSTANKIGSVCPHLQVLSLGDQLLHLLIMCSSMYINTKP